MEQRYKRSRDFFEFIWRNHSILSYPKKVEKKVSFFESISCYVTLHSCDSIGALFRVISRSNAKQAILSYKKKKGKKCNWRHQKHVCNSTKSSRSKRKKEKKTPWGEGGAAAIKAIIMGYPFALARHTLLHGVASKNRLHISNFPADARATCPPVMGGFTGEVVGAPFWWITFLKYHLCPPF